ncbi:SubName: Full=Related to 50S ribosomal protein L4 {ECO:0000313/EMBL:CCA68564.1} [Serendipita indica DSM 11827]|uniref:Large ribosomal subunit protein uL4m n=1 Tax=Serendipita indica (strain DSM 11827) TaxID=1109443 RepID=G4TB79_SERID|nr:SubName: Full=Related to 50S ribosomal protein L4 {ECO:0000313/EMBL:CCA68564.1} [Serendipita indica DSM 11827]CCA68564.1 related to 50S ribosomal protein L4 [Serendipita indica DSM 11827]
MLARRAVATSVCLSRLGRVALLHTAATRAPAQEPLLPQKTKSKIKIDGQVDPNLVEPVLKWLLDDTAKTPFIPVQAKFESKVPTWLELKPFCGEFDKEEPTVVHLDPSVFNHPIRRDILHACIVWYRDSLRRGTASTKSRSEVAYSKRKIRPQKGSGRARLGSRGSPMLRGGGRAFGPKPRDFSTELPRKIRNMGLRVALSTKLRERKLIVVPSVDLEEGKTRVALSRLRKLSEKIEKGCLLINGPSGVPPLLERATNNLQWVACKGADKVQVWDILRHHHTILSLEALQWFQENLGQASRRPELTVGDSPNRLRRPNQSSDAKNASHTEEKA